MFVFGRRGAREDSSADLKIHRGKDISVKPSHWAVKPMKKRKRSCGFGCSFENIIEGGIAGNYMLIYS